MRASEREASWLRFTSEETPDSTQSFPAVGGRYELRVSAQVLRSACRYAFHYTMESTVVTRKEVGGLWVLMAPQKVDTQEEREGESHGTSWGPGDSGSQSLFLLPTFL